MATELVGKLIALARAFSPGHITGFFEVPHDVEIPIGFGLGSSGAAALSLSYALNQVLDIGLNRTQAAQIAHQAEIACNTGLGTVIAEFAGGFEMRTSAGAPGVGSVSKIDLDKNYKAIVLCLAPILTRSFLTNRINEINGLGGIMLSKLSASRSLDDFLEMSHGFAEMLSLTEGRCRGPIAALKTRGIESSVALFGQTVFTVVSEERTAEAVGALREFGHRLIVCNMDKAGARML